jgi:hypothetical protein
MLRIIREAKKIAKVHRKISYNGLDINVAIEHAPHLDMLEKHSREFFSINDSYVEDIDAIFVNSKTILLYMMELAEKVCLSSREKWAFINDRYCIANYYDDDDNNCSGYVLLDRVGKKILVAYPLRCKLSGLVPIRVLRAWIVSILHNNQSLFLHSSAVCRGSAALCIVGSKTVGKTSTLMNLIVSGLFCPIANDKVACTRLEDGRVQVAGLPVRAGIRVPTVESIPRLKSKLSPYIEKIAVFDKYSKEQKHYIHLNDIATSCGVKISPKGILKCIVSPIYSNAVNMSQLVQVTAKEKTSLLDEQFLSTIRQIEPFQSFFECMSEPVNSNVNRLFDMMANIPTYWLIQNKRTNQHSLRLLSELVHQPSVIND